MCGPTAQQEAIGNQQTAFYEMLTDQYKSVFGKQQNILDALTSVYTPIVEAGPNQRGFSAGERADLDTQASESTATNYAHAREAMESGMAARGGGDEYLPSGGDDQLRGELAGMAADTDAGLHTKIDMADWQTGRQQFKDASQVLGGVASELNPVSFGNMTGGAGKAAADTQSEIAAAANSAWAPAVAALSGVGGAAVGGWASRGKKG